MVENTNLARADKIFSVFVIFLPFLHQYRGIISLISFGEMLLIPFIIYYVLTNSKDMKWQISLLSLYFFAVLSIIIGSFFEYFILSDAFSLLVRLIFYALVILVGRHHFNYSYVRKVYKIFVVLMAIYLLTQYVYHTVTGGYLPIYIKYDWLFAPEKRGENLAELYKWFFRPSGLFLEPSYYALFALPALIDMVMGKKKDYISFSIVCIAFLASRAMSGIIAIAIIILFLCFNSTKDENTKRFIFIVLFFGTIGIGLMTDSFSGVIERFRSGGSFDERITRGIVIYRQLPFINKVFGVGLNNLGNYISFYGLNTGYDDFVSLEYCCTLLQCLNFSGIFALGALLVVWMKFWRGSRTSICKCLCIILLFIMCYESILYSYRFAFYLLLVYSWKKELQDNINN